MYWDPCMPARHGRETDELIDRLSRTQLLNADAEFAETSNVREVVVVCDLLSLCHDWAGGHTAAIVKRRGLWRARQTAMGLEGSREHLRWQRVSNAQIPGKNLKFQYSTTSYLLRD